MQIESASANYKVVVIGGGMVGCSFALQIDRLLAGNDQSPILLVESAAQNSSAQQQPGFDARSTALSFGSSKLFQQLEIWDSLREFSTHIREIHVSDRGHFGTARLSSEQEQVEALGYVIENQHLAAVLNLHLHAAQCIESLCPATITAIRPVADGMELIVEKGDSHSTVHTNLVVLADGGRSAISAQLGIASKVTPYQQAAIISNIAFEKPHRHIAYERFTDTGPLAILPLEDLEGEHRGALVWTVAEHQATHFMGLSNEELLPLLQERFGYRLGKITRLGQRSCYPLSLSVASEQVRPGLVLLGNAAHSLHPVAGQGFNLALRDVQVLAGIVAAAILAEKDPGDLQVLQEFVNAQQADQNSTIDFSHYLLRLFSSGSSPLIWARKFGLASIDLIPAVKRRFARQAMGIGDK